MAAKNVGRVAGAAGVACGAGADVGAADRPMAASKKAFCAAARAASAPAAAGVCGAGKALGRIGVTGSATRVCYG